MRTTARERAEVIARLVQLGISYQDAEALRRIANTLRNWFEMECGTERGRATVSIERDENEKPFQRVQYMGPGNQWVDRKYPIADRETGARKRLAALMQRYGSALVSYIQGDCRGASLYILRQSDVRPGEEIDSVYSRGVAVY